MVAKLYIIKSQNTTRFMVLVGVLAAISVVFIEEI